ncbi:MAE_28990/MAE_18760 family HEPN-like nuclease [Sorangium sp. So ce295]|uniref:MAE_28990/MAE_18760 family HEPN-like nuclease n=1 Tax=Sorangium sp. So ce295 TaxID=3133295 RepID=UPI003F60733B
MKVRSEEELAELLQGNLQKRKRELTAMKFLVDKSRAHEQQMLFRVGVALLYAHWEGFVKLAANAYITYVDHQGFAYRDLIPSLGGLALRGMMIDASQSTNKHAGRTKIVEILLDGSAGIARLPIGDFVDAAGDPVKSANLNATVLDDILGLLGLDRVPYEAKRNLIDEKLLKRRNDVAHGELVSVDEATFRELYDEILQLLEQFSTDIMNAAALKRYLQRR